MHRPRFIFHTPTDEEAGYGSNNIQKRVLFMCTCAICKRDYEIRTGKWLPLHTKRGTLIRIRVCSSCYDYEMEDEGNTHDNIILGGQ